MSLQSGTSPDAAEHRHTCRVRVEVEYSVFDVLPPRLEVYPGPGTRLGRRATLRQEQGHVGKRRIWWYMNRGAPLSLASRAPTTGAEVRALWQEIAEAGVAEMFRQPTLSQLIGQDLQGAML